MPTLMRLLRAISAASRDCFFDSLVRELTEILGVDFAFVAEIVEEEPLRGRTVAYYGEGAARENITFRLRNTPCNHVLERGYRFVASGARVVFPDDTLFTKLEIESYAGIALIDDGVLLGWIAVLNRKPFEDEEVVRAILEFMAARATAELRARMLHEALSLAQAKARRDELTTLPNRAHFLQQVEVALVTTRPFAVVVFDLDRFKVINDSLGHVAGDALLSEAAHRIRASVRACDIAARLGGDEFAVLLDGAEEDDAQHYAQRIGAQLEQPFHLDGHDVFTSASAGIACIRGQYHAAADVLRDADTAMYRAKGKARVEVFHNGMHVEALDRMEIEMDLRRAIDRDQFHLVYQQILSAATHEVVAVEALLRWRHPVRGAIAPAAFIPIAEETGSIVAIGEWVLDRACRDLAAWSDASIVNVNLSAVQLQQRDLVARVERIIRERRVEPHRVRLEVTETAIAADPDAAARTLHALRSLGVQLCIDDFGIGYSSLASLLRFPFTSLKIDRSLIAGVGASFEHREMVAAIAALARNLHLDVVAEGIETQEQLEIVEGLGVDLLQGFLLSMPSAIEELVA